MGCEMRLFSMHQALGEVLSLNPVPTAALRGSALGGSGFFEEWVQRVSPMAYSTGQIHKRSFPLQ